MKAVLAICLMLGIVRLSQSLVCPKNFCESVDCSNSPTADQCTNGVIRENGSYCGCCPVCIKYIPAGGYCFSLYLLGHTTARAGCQPPYECIDLVCQKPLQPDIDREISIKYIE